MFTTVVDNAVARYTLPNGTEVAFAYDKFPFNPVEEYEYRIGIQRDERNSLATDPIGVLAEYDHLKDELEELEYTIEQMRKYCGAEAVEKAIAGELEDSPFEWWEEQALERIDQVREELAEITYLEWQDKDEYGWPSYRIAYRAKDMNEDGWNAEKLDSIVKDMAREYSAWANGSMYIMGVEVPGEEVEYLCCHAGFDPYDEEEVKDLLDDYGYNTNGLARS